MPPYVSQPLWHTPTESQWEQPLWADPAPVCPQLRCRLPLAGDLPHSWQHRNLQEPMAKAPLTAMRRRPCSSRMTGWPATWRKCATWSGTTWSWRPRSKSRANAMRPPCVWTIRATSALSRSCSRKWGLRCSQSEVGKQQSLGQIQPPA